MAGAEPRLGIRFGASIEMRGLAPAPFFIVVSQMHPRAERQGGFFCKGGQESALFLCRMVGVQKDERPVGGPAARGVGMEGNVI